MPVDLGDLVPYIKSEAIGPAGGPIFKASTDEDWEAALANAFWTARLNNYFPNYVEVDGIISPINGAPDPLPLTEQHIIVFFAGYNAVKAALLQINTTARYKAGPVDAETQRAATVLTGLLKELRQRITDLRRDMLQGGGGTKVSVLDRLRLEDTALFLGDIDWVR